MRALASITILFTIVGCNDKSSRSTPIALNTPDGNVAASKTIVEPKPQTITPVGGAPLERLQSLGNQSAALVRAYLPDVGDPDLKDYDEAFRMCSSVSLESTPRSR